MAAGFRKSLFGFNCTDVVQYIEKTHKSFSEKEKVWNNKLDDLTSDLEINKKEKAKLIEEKNALDKKLSEFADKYEEIERLSENIGKLYLVAQTNAKAIITNAADNAEITSNEIEKNLFSIDTAHASLQELRENIKKTSDDFIKEVDDLMSSLGETREKITANNKIIEESKAEFNEVFANIVE